MWRPFSDLVRHKVAPGLSAPKRRILGQKLVYRLLLAGSFASVFTTVYLLKPTKRGSLNSGSGRYVQPAEVLEFGIGLDYRESYLIGVIKPGSIHIHPNTHQHSFILTDFIHEIKVHYEGILPGTFREGETARVQGEFVDDYNPVEMVASHVQGAHDAEKKKNMYQPRSRDISLKSRSF